VVRKARDSASSGLLYSFQYDLATGRRNPGQQEIERSPARYEVGTIRWIAAFEAVSPLEMTAESQDAPVQA
jgi:hypothetical protein